MSANETVLPGERLRRAREEKGLSQEEACKHLRLSTSYMRALEQDDYERLPEAPFIKGYLRNYARFLGLPAEELARQFQQRVDEMRQDEREREQAALDEAPSNREWRLPALAVLVVVLLVAVGWWLWPRGDMSAPEPSVDDGGRGGEETFDSPAPPQAPRPPPRHTMHCPFYHIVAGPGIPFFTTSPTTFLQYLQYFTTFYDISTGFHHMLKSISGGGSGSKTRCRLGRFPYSIFYWFSCLWASGAPPQKCGKIMW